MSVCKLCLKDKDLIKKSHIIPDFMYQYLYDAKHRIIFATTTTLVDKSIKPRTKPSGIYEGGILCDKCDNHVMGQYESYAAKALFGKNIPSDIAPKTTNYFNRNGQTWSRCENIDYKKYKLFLLSILWKAHHSTHNMFKEISLGPHQDIIRRMIIEGDPRLYNDYPISHWTTAHDNSISIDYILQPRKGKMDLHTFYLFPVSGMFFIFYVSSHAKPQIILENCLKEDGSMNIGHISAGKSGIYLLKYLGLI